MLKLVDHIDGFSGYVSLLQVGVPHRGHDVGVTEDFLDLIEIESVLDQSGGMRMAQSVSSAICQTSTVEGTTE